MLCRDSTRNPRNICEIKPRAIDILPPSHFRNPSKSSQFSNCKWRIAMSAAGEISGKSKWGLSNGGLRPLSLSLQFVHNRVQLCTFVAFRTGNFRHKMTTILGNRGQLWTSTLSPHLQSPHLDFQKITGSNRKVKTQIAAF